MTINDILRTKGREVVTIHPDRTVLEAMRVLVRYRIGAVVAIHDNEIHGILSERDILNLGAEDPGLLARQTVGDIMTREMITASPTESLNHVMDLMTQHRIRHLPIIEEHRLTGIVSIGDVVNACRTSAEQENDQLREYIRGSIS